MHNSTSARPSCSLSSCVFYMPFINYNHLNIPPKPCARHKTTPWHNATLAVEMCGTKPQYPRHTHVASEGFLAGFWWLVLDLKWKALSKSPQTQFIRDWMSEMVYNIEKWIFGMPNTIFWCVVVLDSTFLRTLLLLVLVLASTFLGGIVWSCPASPSQLFCPFWKPGVFVNVLVYLGNGRLVPEEG